MTTVYTVTNDRMLIASVLSMPCGEENANRLFVDLDESWKNFTVKEAVFADAKNLLSQTLLLDEGSFCAIPGEFFAQEGTFTVTVQAKDENGDVQKTSLPLSVRAQNGTISVVPTSVTPDIKEHIAALHAVLAEKMDHIEKPFISFLPIKDYYVSDTEQRLYLNEIALFERGRGYFKVSSPDVTYPEIRVGDNGVTDYICFDVTSKTEFELVIRYLCHGELVARHTLTVHVAPAALPTKKYLFLGDSLTEAGYIQKQFKELNGDSVILYGTREKNGLLHEGRSSWGINHYFTEKKGEVLNSFFNPETQTFDFSYYMAQNPSFADVDIVNIFLGRNNGFNPGILENIDKIVASVKAFNPAITVTLMGAYNVACDNSGTGRYLQSADEFNFAAHRYNKVFYERYADSTDVLLIPAHLNLDNKYDYTTTEEPVSQFDDRKMTIYSNNVHPDERGYRKLGVGVSAFFRYILNR